MLHKLQQRYEDQGLERLEEQIGVEIFQGCSAPMRSSAAICQPYKQVGLLSSVSRSPVNKTLHLANELFQSAFLPHLTKKLDKTERKIRCQLSLTKILIETRGLSVFV